MKYFLFFSAKQYDVFYGPAENPNSSFLAESNTFFKIAHSHLGLYVSFLSLQVHNWIEI